MTTARRWLLVTAATLLPTWTWSFLVAPLASSLTDGRRATSAVPTAAWPEASGDGDGEASVRDSGAVQPRRVFLSSGVATAGLVGAGGLAPARAEQGVATVPTAGEDGGEEEGRALEASWSATDGFASQGLA